MKNDIYSIIRIGIIIVFAFLIQCQTNLFSQNNQKAQQNKAEKPQEITVEQKAQIQKILSQFNSATINADQAKEIHSKFREAGIHAGTETNEAIIAAGFDPEKIRALAPPPSDQKKEQAQPSSEERLKIVETNIIVPLSLGTVQQDKIKTIFKDFFTEIDKLKSGSQNNGGRPDKTVMETYEKARDNKIKEILSNEQYNKYLELEKTTHPARPNEEGSKK